MANFTSCLSISSISRTKYAWISSSITPLNTLLYSSSNLAILSTQSFKIYLFFSKLCLIYALASSWVFPIILTSRSRPSLSLSKFFTWKYFNSFFTHSSSLTFAYSLISFFMSNKYLYLRFYISDCIDLNSFSSVEVIAKKRAEN